MLLIIFPFLFISLKAWGLIQAPSQAHIVPFPHFHQVMLHNEDHYETEKVRGQPPYHALVLGVASRTPKLMDSDQMINPTNECFDWYLNSKAATIKALIT